MSKVYGEETEVILAPSGIIADRHDSFIPDSFCHKADNFVSRRGVLESRKGFNEVISWWNTNDYISHKFSHVDTRNSDLPCLVWRSGTTTVMLRNLDPRETSNVTGNTLIQPVHLDTFRSACLYGDRLYLRLANGLFPVTAINWASQDVTLGVSIVNVPNCVDVFTFKDRMWGYGIDGNLYFTDVAEFGGYPETWNAVTQNVAFGGPGEDTTVYQVIPLGNKLLVFASNGYYTLHVEGQPGSWVKRTLKPNFRGLTRQQAVEYNGVVYFIDQEGVWATNGLTINKVSQALDSAFEEKYNEHFPVFFLNVLDEGLVASIRYIHKVNSTTLGTNGPACRTFYSRIETLAWTEWNLKRPHSAVEPVYNLDGILCVSPTVNTVNGKGSIQYALMSVTASKPGSYRVSTVNGVKYDGYFDAFSVNTASGNQGFEADIELLFESRFMDGQFPTRIKRGKNGFLSIAQPQAIDVKTSWILDAGTELPDFTVPSTALSASNFRKQSLIAITADFFYHAVAFRLKARLNSGNATIPFKFFASYLVKDTGRRDDFAVR